MKRNFVIGIDEVGRGPLAGPVTVAALALPTDHRGRYRDSKRLSAKQRREYFTWLNQAHDITFATASVFPATIDRINITQAANLAATRALGKLLATSHLGLANSVKIMLDGGLYVDARKLVANSYLPDGQAGTLKPRTVIRGDEKFNAIKLASIVAKVKRDALMDRYHKKYPTYGFERHKGYGTRQHYRALKKHGPSKIHRLTFIGKGTSIVSKSEARNPKSETNSKS